MQNHRTTAARSLYWALPLIAVYSSLSFVCGETVRTLHSFTQPGVHSYAEVLIGSDGSLYGTTHEGGVMGQGTVFSVKPDGSGLRVLHSFNTTVLGDGASPHGGLIQASDGALYGTTYSGAVPAPYGVIYRINPDGSGFQSVHSFVRYSDPQNGASPNARLVQGGDGKLYGTTIYGGASDGGSVFRVDLDGSNFQLLHSFGSNSSDGSGPLSWLIEAPGGILFGTTPNGGAHGSGTIFRVSRDGTGYQVIHDFDGSNASDGTQPQSGLVALPDGNLYGTTPQGGSNKRGTIFRIAPDGSGFQLIHSFNSLDANDGSTPDAGLIVGSDGYLYGTTFGNGVTPWGTVFKVRPDGSGFQSLHAFNDYDRRDGASPEASLIQAADGTLYGTTLYGGAINKGSVFTIRSDGSGFRLVYSIGVSEGAPPNGGLIVGADGDLYGTTFLAGGHGAGSVFRLGSDGTNFQVLHSFDESDRNDGAFPTAGLVQASDGKFYGDTSYGGNSDDGMVYRLDSDGSHFSYIWPIPGVPGGELDAASPQASLIQAKDGNLYGVTYGTAFFAGIIFRLGLDGTCTLLYTPEAPAGPSVANLIQGSDNNLYGTGGAAVFRASPDGHDFKVLHVFNGSDGGGSRAPLLEASNGALYGTTAEGGLSGAGNIFRVMPDGSDFEIVHNFNDSNPVDGSYPYSGLIEGPDGYLYGATTRGGPTNPACNCGFGTIYRISPDGSDFQIIYSFTGGSDGANPISLLLGPGGDFFGATLAGGAYGAGSIFRLAGPRLPLVPVKGTPRTTKPVAPR